MGNKSFTSDCLFENITQSLWVIQKYINRVVNGNIPFQIEFESNSFVPYQEAVKFLSYDYFTQHPETINANTKWNV